MEENPVPLSPEVLHAQRDWVRRVARALVVDENSAEDLEQQVWVKALEKRPRVRRSVRAWLGTVLRNAAVDLRRAGLRRGRHERAAGAAAAAGTAPAADDLVAKAEALRLVVAAVLDLREPYRTTVLLRFFEDLAPGEIAKRQGIPLETVRTRLRRALAELRGRLDEDRGGDRRAWRAALLPLALPGAPGLPFLPAGIREPGAWSGADRAARTAAEGFREVTVMGIRVAVVAFLSLAILAGAVWWAFPPAPEPPPAPAPVAALPADPTAAAPGETEGPVPGTGARVVEEGGRNRKVFPLGRVQDASKQGLPAEAEAAVGNVDEWVAWVAAEKAKAAGGKATEVPGPESLQDLTTDDLKKRLDAIARTPTWQRKEPPDVEGGLRIVEALLARNLEPADRSAVLVDKAILHRMGPGADPVLEEAALREAATVEDQETPGGREVLFQLAWTRSRRGDDREAMDLFDRVASHPSTDAGRRATNRWEAAARADRLGEGDRARRWYREFVDENGDNAGPWFREKVSRAKERLKALE